MTHNLAEIEVRYYITAETESKAITKGYRNVFNDVPEGRELTTEFKDVKEVEGFANKPYTKYVVTFRFTIELDESLAGIDVHNVGLTD